MPPDMASNNMIRIDGSGTGLILFPKGIPAVGLIMTLQPE